MVKNDKQSGASFKEKNETDSKDEKNEEDGKKKTMSDARCSATQVDGGYGWIIVLGSFIAHAFLLGLVRSFGVLFIELLRRFEKSATETAMVFATFNTLRMLLAPFVSVVCKRFSCRFSMFIGGIGLCSGFVASAFAKHLWQLTVTYGVVCGLSASFLFTPPYIIVGEYFEKKKGKAMALGTVGAGVGSIVMGPLIVLLLNTYSYFGCMLILGALQLHHCIVGALFKPFNSSRTTSKHTMELIVKSSSDAKNASFSNCDNKSDGDNDNKCHGLLSDKCVACDENRTNAKEQRSELEISNSKMCNSVNCVNSSVQVADTHGKTGQEVNSELLEHTHTEIPHEQTTGNTCLQGCAISLKKKISLFKTSTMWLYCLGISTMSAAFGMVIWFVADSSKVYGASDTQAALLTSIIGASDVVGRLAWGPVFDLKLFRKRRRMLHSMLGIVCGLIVVIYGFQTTYYGYAVCCCVFGLFEGGYHSQRVTIISEIVPKSMQPETVGISIFSQGIGNLLGSLLGGHSKDTYGTYAMGYFVAGSLQGVVCALFLLDYFLKSGAIKCTKRR